MTNVAVISQQIWDMKYRLKSADGVPVDKSIDDSWRRVAENLAQPEKERDVWAERFYRALQGFEFLPAGRIIAGAGAGRKVTLFNCFVMGTIPDDMSGIFQHLKEAALTMQQGGGIGYDFSTLRPKGAPVKGVGADASGPLSFMDVWDSMCRTIMSAGARRGAMMATMRCDHPDIEAFVEAKREPGRLRMFNLSVLVSDAFMAAVRDDRPWDLAFDGVCWKTLPAKELWEKIMRATYAYAEPGVIFIDRINRLNNLNYCEEIYSCNPCGEQALPPYGACLLGSINLARLVRDPFEDTAALDIERLRELVPIAVRMLDNAIDVSGFPLPEQAHEARAKRRMGLGITGLGDALIMCRARYGADAALGLTEGWMKEIQRAAYLASSALAAEKGAFPLYDAEKYLQGESVKTLDADVRDAIGRDGIRNALLTSVAPTGTISLFADNVSSGLEPVFSFTYSRHIRLADGESKEEEVSDFAYRLFRRLKGEDAPLPDYFVDTQLLDPGDHIVMQALVQKYVDSSISKTINVPEGIAFDDFKDVYDRAYDTGCKGCTTYRPNEVTGAVLEVKDADETAEPELPLDEPPARAETAYETGGVVYMTQPLHRPEELPGKTYKIKWPESDHAMYITLNDVVRDRRRRPFEIFINSKNMDNYAWTVALTRMISAVFRRGGDVSFVVEELKAVFDPRGGQWMGGKYVPSLLAAIGDVIEHHMIDIGFLASPKERREGRLDVEGPAMKRVVGLPDARFRQCPKCGEASIIRQENCDVCVSCAYSKCS